MADAERSETASDQQQREAAESREQAHAERSPVGLQQRRSADSLRGKVETVVWFFNKGMLGFALAGFLAYMLYQIFTGKVQIKVPAMSSDSDVAVAFGPKTDAVSPLGGVRAEEMFKELTNTHAGQLKVAENSLEVQKLLVSQLERQTQVLNEISCRLYRTDAEQIRCLKRALRHIAEQP